MGRWVIKWNRNDRFAAGAARDWSVALAASKPVERYGTAEGVPKLGSLSAGNVALAYQTDDRAFVGVVRVLSIQATAREPYARVERVHRFARPVRLAEICARYPQLVGIDAFATGGLHSMRRLSPDEFKWLLEGCGVDAATRTRMNV